MQAADASDEHRGLVHGPDHALHSPLVGLLGLQVQVGVPGIQEDQSRRPVWGTCSTIRGGVFIVLPIPTPNLHSPIHLQGSFPLSHQRHSLSIPDAICHRLSNPNHTLCTVLHPQTPYLRNATLRDLNVTRFQGHPHKWLIFRTRCHPGPFFPVVPPPLRSPSTLPLLSLLSSGLEQ